MVHFSDFWYLKVWVKQGYQTEEENAEIKKIKCDILSNFQTMWEQV